MTENISNEVVSAKGDRIVSSFNNDVPGHRSAALNLSRDVGVSVLTTMKDIRYRRLRGEIVSLVNCTVPARRGTKSIDGKS